MEIIFRNPEYLWFLVSIILLVIVHIFTLKHVKRKALKFANFDAISRVTGKQILSQNTVMLSLRIFTLIFATLALAGITITYIGNSNEFSFVLAIDASSSMTAEDFEPSRLEAAKLEAISFVNSLSSETSLGVISFSGTSFIEQDITTDLGKVKEKISKIEIKKVGGTDLGEAIITSTNLLTNEEKSKVIILLTDGRSNIGIDPREAVGYAIKTETLIYTIGMATIEGGTLPETKEKIRLSLDEDTLKTISFNTGGEYFRATDEISLKEAYRKISKSTAELLTIDLTLLFMTIALLLLFLEWALLNTKYRTIP